MVAGEDGEEYLDCGGRGPSYINKIWVRVCMRV